MPNESGSLATAGSRRKFSTEPGADSPELPDPGEFRRRRRKVPLLETDPLHGLCCNRSKFTYSDCNSDFDFEMPGIAGDIQTDLVPRDELRGSAPIRCLFPGQPGGQTAQCCDDYPRRSGLDRLRLHGARSDQNAAIGPPGGRERHVPAGISPPVA